MENELTQDDIHEESSMELQDVEINDTQESSIDTTAVLDRIQTAMNVYGFRGIDINNALGLSTNQFSMWKTGRSTTFIKHIDGISRVLGVSADYLLHGYPGGTPEPEQIFSDLIEKDISNNALAQELGIKPTNVYTWHSSGKIPAKHIENILCILHSTHWDRPDNPNALSHRADKTGIFKALKKKHISKQYLAEQLGLSRSAVYQWKGDQEIPDKYVPEIRRILDDDYEAATSNYQLDNTPDNSPTIEEVEADMVTHIDSMKGNADGTQPVITDDIPTYVDEDIIGAGLNGMDDEILKFTREMSTYISLELRGLSPAERNSCLQDLETHIRLSLKNIKIYTKAATALGLG